MLRAYRLLLSKRNKQKAQNKQNGEEIYLWNSGTFKFTLFFGYMRNYNVGNSLRNLNLESESSEETWKLNGQLIINRDWTSVQFSCSVVSDSLQCHGLQHIRPPCPSPIPRVYSNSCPLSWWCHPTISFSVIPFSSPSPPAFNLSQHQDLFQWVSSSHLVAKVLEFQHQSFQWIFRTDFL